MNKEEINKVGVAYYEAFHTHQQVDLPHVEFPTITYDDAYAIQKVFVGKLIEDGYTLSGKKIGLTSKAMWKISGIYEPDYGYIFAEMGHENECELNRDNFIAPRIECELAFKLKADLDYPNVTAEDVRKATEFVVPCLEICDFRMYRDKGQRWIQDSIADNAAFGGYILGDNPVYIDNCDLSLVPYVFEVNDKQVEVSSGAAVLDDPLLAVAWLANTFYKLGTPLRKGELILSGSAVASIEVKKNMKFKCKYGTLGEVSCRFR